MKGGKVNGNVNAREAILGGEVKGSIVVEERVGGAGVIRDEWRGWSDNSWSLPPLRRAACRDQHAEN